MRNAYPYDLARDRKISYWSRTDLQPEYKPPSSLPEEMYISRHDGEKTNGPVLETAIIMKMDKVFNTYSESAL